MRQSGLNSQPVSWESDTLTTAPPVQFSILPVQWQGNAHPVASMQVLIDQTLDELCNVMETHLSEFTFAFINC